MTHEETADIRKRAEMYSQAVARRDVLNLCDALDATREALAELFALYRRKGEDCNEHFERVGEDFRRDTGMLRPGKDSMMDDREERAVLFDAWRDKKYVAAQSAIRPRPADEARAVPSGDWRGLPIPPGETRGSMVRVWTIETTPDYSQDFNIFVTRSYQRAVDAAKEIAVDLMDSISEKEEVEITIRIKTEMMMLEDVPEGGG